jgi:hypothetical protein
VYLLSVFASAGTVRPEDAFAMSGLTPTERLEWLNNQGGSKDVGATVQRLLEQYDRFLERTNAPEENLLQMFLDKDANRRFMNEANEFGDSIARLLETVGNGTRLYRVLIV